MIPSAAARMLTRVPAGLTRAAAAVVSAVLLCALAAPAAALSRLAPGPVAGETPLRVSVDSINPSAVPSSGNVTLTGQITNRSESRWTDLRVYMFMSSMPMRTSAELRSATATPENADVGSRLTGQGLYTQASDLAPGQSTFYTLSVPVQDLPVSGPGVYWIGVHVLGTNEQGRLAGADGRARTFIADMPARGPRATLALAIPLRAAVRRTPDGRLANVKAWNRRLSDEGRLTRLLNMARTSPDVPVTWVVDPAVLDAVRSLAEGNPPFDLSPTDEQAQQSHAPGGSTGGSASGSASASPDVSGTPSESPGPVGPTESGQGDPTDKVGQVAPESLRASNWLSDFVELARQQTVLGLPYGDVDVPTLLRGDVKGVLARADELTAKTMQDLGLGDKAVVAPSNGLLPGAMVEQLRPDTTVLLSERAARTDATTIGFRHGPDAVLTSEAARTGGPRPTPRFEALAIRQRVLAEAAVRALGDPAGRPLVVAMPNQWDPGSAWANASFFTGLDVPWIRMVDVPFARMLSRRAPYDGRLLYTRTARRYELPVPNVLATQELDHAGKTLADLLTRNDTIDEQVARAAMLGSSSNARLRHYRALQMTRSISAEVHHQLNAVSVQGSPLVTMSSGTGNMTVRVVNGLDQPVTVGLRAATGTDELKVRDPDLVTLGPGQRASVRMAVTATGTGVHAVRIRPTTRDGETLGASARIKVRSSQVGLVIWLIMGTGAVVFVAAIIARIVRQVRSRKNHPDEVEDREQEEVAS